ncbi:MAG: type II toxin-antitoxin system RelE/ParE family toxin [Deltaproteobacteria bacterium]|nr:type II toxin-antitoxin system RelE/ParE family toxin [Deltaproteobacteria bacterium]
MILQFSKAALHDLKRLREFIAHDNPTTAQRISKRLQGAIKKLMDAPRIGRPVEDMPGEIREFIFGRYVVRYEVRKDVLYILRIWHGRENR